MHIAGLPLRRSGFLGIQVHVVICFEVICVVMSLIGFAILEFNFRV